MCVQFKPIWSYDQRRFQTPRACCEKIAPIPTHTRPFNQAQAALDDLRAGRIVGRTVLEA